MQTSDSEYWAFFSAQLAQDLHNKTGANLKWKRKKKNLNI